MTRLSSRYVPHIVVILVLAGIPTLLHSWGRFEVEDCANPAALLVVPQAGARRSEGWANARWLERASPTRQWVEGRIPIEGTALSLETVIVRSYDPKILYHQPELALVRQARSEHANVEWFEHAGERLPIHWPEYDSEPAAVVAAYVLVYRGRPVANPYLAQLLAAPLQVVTGRSPMTLLFVRGAVPVGRRELSESLARKWLASAWDQYRAACHP
jgi:hypothetical protein